MHIQLPSYVKTAIDVLERAGFEAYVVGGCVRDAFLDREPGDWDITTDATPDEMISIFGDFRVIPTGVKHGTVTVIVDDNNLEITTYRIDGKYTDSRRPENVTFSKDISEDLARRDFTINAMAYNDRRGLVDLYGGMQDLRNGIIRCVGDADERFKEDALRIMRAIRFSSVLGFEIDEDTKKGILRNCGDLRNISVERVSTELLKLLCGKDVTRVLMEYRDVIAVIIPELERTFDFEQRNKHHIYTVYDHIAHAVGHASPEPDVRLALLLHDMGKPDTYFADDDGVGHFYGHAERGAEMALDILGRLRFSREMIDMVYTLILYHDYPIEANRKIVRHRLRKFGEPVLRQLMKVKIGDSLAHNPAYLDRLTTMKQVNVIIEEILNEGECFDLKALKISGADLQTLGMEPGRDMGLLLNRLLADVIDEKVENSTEPLMEYARHIIETEF